MKKFILIYLIIFISCGFIAAQQNIAEEDSIYQQRMEWFGKAKFGVFIHWGIYSVNGISESWSFFNKYLPYDEYMKQTKGFTAKNYNPKEWVDLIKQSGARYTVITTKHHDGVALWDTKAGNLSVKKSTAAARDVLKPFAEEVRKQGLKLGLYYSLLDWSHPDYPNKTKTEKRYENDSVRWNKFVKFNFAQLEELNKTWKPDLYWFDGDWEQSAEQWHAKEIVETLRRDNPGVIINSRIKGYGDYATPEIGVPVVRPKSQYWELCMTMNDSWGYQPTDTNYKTPNMLLRIFVDCLSMGGNLLLDIGPKPDGTIDKKQKEILRSFGRWINKHSEAIFDTRAGIPHEYFNGYTTLNEAGDVLYLYLPYKPIGNIELKGIKNKIQRAYIVGNGTMLNFKEYNRPYWSAVPGNVFIDIPEEALDENITVIAVLLDGKIQLYGGEGNVIESN